MQLFPDPSDGGHRSTKAVRDPLRGDPPLSGPFRLEWVDVAPSGCDERGDARNRLSGIVALAKLRSRPVMGCFVMQRGRTQAVGDPPGIPA